MPILTSDQFEEIKRLDAERTPGEWQATDIGWQWNIKTDALLHPNFGATHNVGAIEHTGQLLPNDVLFMVACSWVVPALIAEVEHLHQQRSLNDEAVERIVPVVETFVQEIERLQDYILDLPDADGRHLRFLEQVSGTPTLQALEDWIGQKQTLLPTIRPSTAENGEER